MPCICLWYLLCYCWSHAQYIYPVKFKMSLWTRKFSALFMFLFKGNLPESNITVENWKVSRPEEGGRSLFKHWQWILIKFRRRVRADNEELLVLIIPLSNIFTTWSSNSCLGPYWVWYWGRLTGAVFPNNIWCSMTSVQLMSLVSSSWNTCEYFSGWVQLTVFHPVKNDIAFLATACNIKSHFSFFVRFNWIVWFIFGVYFVYKNSEISSATPRTEVLGTTNGSVLKLANITYAQRLGAPVSEWLLWDITRDVSCPFDWTRDNALADSIPSIGIWADSTQTSEGRFAPFQILTFQPQSVRNAVPQQYSS